jgi:hypothetical protein
MATPTLSPIGPLRIPVDGQWDIQNLLALAQSMTDSYGLFYPLLAQDPITRTKLQSWLRQEFWSGDPERMPQVLYTAIPSEEKLKLKSFRYASLGAIEFTGVLLVLLLLSRVARSYIQTGNDLVALLQRVEKYFERKRHLRRPRKQFTLDSDLSLDSEEARALVFEIAPKFGFDDVSCNKLIEIMGNPISTLKYLALVGREGRKLAVLQSEGLLELPQASTEIALLTSPATRNREDLTKAVRRSLAKKKPPSKK